MTTQTNSTEVAALRNFLRSEYGDRKYRITTSGEVHVHGQMPNTNQDGWWFYGYLSEILAERRTEANHA